MNEENTNASAPENAAEQENTQPAAEKTFTQKELDDIVKQRLDRERKSLPSKEELKAFREWQDKQKTAEELSAEKIAAANSRAEIAEARCAAFAKGVKPDAVDDVIALARARVGGDVTIEDAIAQVTEKYPSFCNAVTVPAGEEKPKITTGVSFNGGDKAVSGVEAAFLKRNPGLKI